MGRQLFIWLMVLLCSDACLAGDVRGTVTITSAIRAHASGGGVKGYGGSGDNDHAAPVSRADETRYVVVYLVSDKLKATPTTRTIHQKNREFMPHVLPVSKGSEVVFTNEDNFLHSLYSDSFTKKFELPKYAKGMAKRILCSRPGVIELFCNIHSRMNGYILVLDNDYFTMPAKDNSYLLKNVPPGSYELHAWHPRTNPTSMKIEVPASGSVQANINL